MKSAVDGEMPMGPIFTSPADSARYSALLTRWVNLRRSHLSTGISLNAINLSDDDEGVRGEEGGTATCRVI